VWALWQAARKARPVGLETGLLDLERRSRGNVAGALTEHQKVSVLVGTFVLVRGWIIGEGRDSEQHDS
jgi:hypothetical protein